MNQKDCFNCCYWMDGDLHLGVRIMAIMDNERCICKANSKQNKTVMTMDYEYCDNFRRVRWE